MTWEEPDQPYLERVKMRRACSYCRKSLGWHDFPLVRACDHLCCLCDECVERAFSLLPEKDRDMDCMYSIYTLVTVLEAEDYKK